MEGLARTPVIAANRTSYVPAARPVVSVSEAGEYVESEESLYSIADVVPEILPSDSPAKEVANPVSPAGAAGVTTIDTSAVASAPPL